MSIMDIIYIMYTYHLFFKDILFYYYKIIV